MTNREVLLGDILSRIADELNITDPMFEKAATSYRAVGQWIGDGISYKATIMPQGSMNLGTVVRPLNDRDDYDIDLVCLLEDGKGLDPKKVKHIVGNRLKENKTYTEKLEEEGKRCWTMQYDEFHMDILPCIPSSDRFVNPGSTEIKLTDKNRTEGVYQFKLSNPAAYHDWFVEKARPLVQITDSRKAAKATEIKPVPSQTSRLKTPLQKAIQLLKRHRDVCFVNNRDIAPISVIITTLAAQACPHEANVYVALRKILDCMPTLVEIRGSMCWVPNPVMAEENFAEKWNVDSNKKQAFYGWCEKAKADLISVTSCNGLDELAARYKKVLMPQPVERAFKRYGDDARKSREEGSLRVVGLMTGLSSAAVAGKVVAAHSFYGA